MRVPIGWNTHIYLVCVTQYGSETLNIYNIPVTASSTSIFEFQPINTFFFLPRIHTMHL